jgi:preprotein translocase subunit SecG
MIIILIFAIIASILLGLVVLIQNPKGGGLNSQMGGIGNQIFGASKSTDVVEKATWYIAGALLIICLGAAWMTKGGNTTSKNNTKIEKTDVEKNINKYKGGSSTYPGK